MPRIITLLALATLLSACSLIPQSAQTTLTQPPAINQYQAQPTVVAPTEINNSTPSSMTTPTVPVSATTAVIKTSLGDITVTLFPDKAPQTVANFAGLATGSKEWTDPKSGQKQTGKSLYAGTIFHRVIKDFMIQGGDPLGTGTGGPGYKFADEKSDLTFDQPYLLAMANAGPNTNGSQFFITTVPTTWLNGKHTIFGKVIKGQEVVDKIESSQTDSSDRPTPAVTIQSIEIK